MKVYLIGVGLGNKDTLTVAAERAIRSSAALIGAPRLLEAWPDKVRVPAIFAQDVAQAVHAQREGPVAVLFSGDLGFYSGAKELYPRLADCEVEVFPGLSSLVYFCARLRAPWEDVHAVSAHGRALDAVGEIQSHRKTFLLTGGKTKAEDICRGLCARGLGEVRASVGERLSYPDERVLTGTARELAEEHFQDLSVLLVENDRPIVRAYNAPGLPDAAFERGDVPMTKEEIRALAICKLHLEPWHTLWDVGAGTGSISVEGALAVPKGRVLAIERRAGAIELLQRNKARFGLCNLEIVSGLAPEVLTSLSPPDRVFLGGTGGWMEDILRLALEKSPSLRFVLTAVTLETVCEALRCFQALELGEPELVQIAATRTRKAGRYHLMDAQDPVWLICGEGRGEARG